MNNLKHTPGPWTFAEKPDYTLVGPEGHSICTYHVSQKSEAIDLANARLIAAAPELLAALELARDTLSAMHHNDIRVSFNEELDTIDNAIAKARVDQ